MNEEKEMVFSCNKLQKLMSAIFFLIMMIPIIYFKVNYEPTLELLIIYYSSFIFPFISLFIIISIILEIKRGYAIKLNKLGISIGFYSISFLIPWDSIISISLQQRVLWKWRYTNKQLLMDELVINYSNEKCQLSRKINLFDHMYNFVFPYLKGNLKLSNKMINNKANQIINVYQERQYYTPKK